MTTRLEAGPGEPAGGASWRRFAWLPMLGIAAAALALLMLVAGRYGYHRDELYFVAASSTWPGGTSTSRR